jgi:hypothetical protein
LAATGKYAVSRIVAAVIGVTALIALNNPAAAEPTVTELPLENGSI